MVFFNMNSDNALLLQRFLLRTVRKKSGGLRVLYYDSPRGWCGNLPTW